MKLRGIEFGNILGASGVQGFFGEGWWFHSIYKKIFPKRFDFKGMTFVSKTATLHSRKGNKIKRDEYGLNLMFPSWVRVKFWKGLMLNAMGLPNPGLRALLRENKWQRREEPFMISLASVANSPSRRLDEFREMIDLLGEGKGYFRAPFALQINLSCPNTGHNTKELIGESEKVLEVASALKVPLMPKYSIASAPTQAILELNDNPHCDAICVSNTLPFGWKQLDWKEVWGSDHSPLEKIGGGGLSGKELQSLVCGYIAYLRYGGFTQPINGGGGIDCSQNVNWYCNAGASSCFLGSGATLRPWRVRPIIDRANNISWN